jgi:hypothetical protein
MPTTITLRCERLTLTDQNPANMRAVHMVSNDKANAQYEPAVVQSASFDGTFFESFGAEITEGNLYTVTIAPVAAA